MCRLVSFALDSSLSAKVFRSVLNTGYGIDTARGPVPGIIYSAPDAVVRLVRIW